VLVRSEAARVFRRRASVWIITPIPAPDIITAV
jgi:hypothetical protein